MLQIESRIENVTVYSVGAKVYRSAKVPYKTGQQRVEVEVVGLPLSLADTSLRVKVDPAFGAKVSVASARVELWVPPLSLDDEESLEGALKSARRAAERNRDAQDQVQTEIGLLRAIPVPARPEGEAGKPPPMSPMAARVALESICDDAIEARLAELEKLRGAQRELDEKVTEIQRKLSFRSTALQVKEHELKKAVVVELVATSDVTGDVPIVVEYLVDGARWSPTYQVKMSRLGTSADIVLRAMVCQRTGEDWRGVKLTLSTALPLAWTELPELTSIRIGKAQPYFPKSGFRPPPAGANSLFSDFDRDLVSMRNAAPTLAQYQAPSLPTPPPPLLHIQPPPLPSHVASFAQTEGAIGKAVATGSAVYEEREQDDFCAEMAPEEPPAPKGRGGYGGPPPPPPARSMAYPAAPAMAPPAMMAPAPAAAPLARPVAAEKRKRAAPPSDGRYDEAPAEPENELAVLLFTSLTLSRPSDQNNRTKLQATNLREQYLQSLLKRKRSISFDVITVITRAVEQAFSVRNLPAPAGSFDVRTAAGYFDYAYRADAPVDVTSDGQFHSVAVGSRTAPSDMKYVVVPREDSGVFRQAVIRNPLKSPFLPGPCEIYVGGDYVLTSYLPMVPAEGSFELGLGVEQAIKCARNTLFREQRSGDKVVATNELWHTIKIDLVNNLDRAIEIQVRERIPQPAKDAEVVVEEAGVSPPWEVYKQEERGKVIEGGRKWTVTMTAGEAKSLEATYVVKIYSQNEVVGGNRREA